MWKECITVLLAFGCAGRLIWEDFRYRMISPWLVIVLAFLGIVFQIFQQDPAGLYIIGANLLHLLIIGMGLKAYFLLKGEWQILDRKIGKGDVFFLLALAMWLPPSAFLSCYLMATFAAILLSLLMGDFKKPKTQIPLVSYLGISFCIVQGLIIWNKLSIIS